MKESLERAGHIVVAEAETLQQARELAKRLSEENVTTAIVDGNLREGISTGKDGFEIAQQIRNEAPQVKIVLFSGANYRYGDVYVSKTGFYKNEEDLGTVVTSL